MIWNMYKYVCILYLFPWHRALLSSTPWLCMPKHCRQHYRNNSLNWFRASQRMAWEQNWESFTLKNYEKSPLPESTAQGWQLRPLNRPKNVWHLLKNHLPRMFSPFSWHTNSCYCEQVSNLSKPENQLKSHKITGMQLACQGIWRESCWISSQKHPKPGRAMAGNASKAVSSWWITQLSLMCLLHDAKVPARGRMDGKIMRQI